MICSECLGILHKESVSLAIPSCRVPSEIVDMDLQENKRILPQPESSIHCFSRIRLHSYGSA
jgi:hypothetical protein